MAVACARGACWGQRDTQGPSAERVRDRMSRLSADDKRRITEGCEWHRLTFDERLARIEAWDQREERTRSVVQN